MVRRSSRKPGFVSRPAHRSWAYVPAALFWIVLAWIRYGLLGVLAVVGGGIGLTLIVMWRAGRFRRRIPGG